MNSVLSDKPPDAGEVSVYKNRRNREEYAT